MDGIPPGPPHDTVVPEKESTTWTLVFTPSFAVVHVACVLITDVKKWGIVGIGLMPWDSKMYNILKEQDHLYTLLSRGHTGSEARVVGSIVDFMFAPEDHQAVIDKVCGHVGWSRW